MDCFMGTILPWAVDYAPEGWMLCAGQTLPINQYSALFALLGTRYGGDGVSNFKLPDLQGRMMVGAGNGTGLTARTLGQTGGAESNSLSTSNMPTHNHALMGNINSALTGTNTPANTVIPGIASDSTKKAANVYSNVTSGVPTLTAMNTMAIGSTGGVSGTSAPFSIVQPFGVVNFIICIYGMFPPRQ